MTQKEPAKPSSEASSSLTGILQTLQADEGSKSAPPKNKARPGLQRLNSEGSAKLLLDIPAGAERSASSQDGSRTQQEADARTGELGPSGPSRAQTRNNTAVGPGEKPIRSQNSLPNGDTPHRAGLWSTAPASSLSSNEGSGRSLPGDKESGRELPFLQYLRSELNPSPLYPTADAIWGQTERQRVYNAIAYVPYQLERLVWFSILLCCDSFLAVFTILPIRFVRALHSIGIFDQRWKHRKMKLQGQQLTDVLCVVMFALTFLFLNSLDAGAIYFWMKDLTQEFLKLQVIYTAVEIFDKIACSFAVDSLEALSGTCTLFTSSPNKRNHFAHLASDFLVTLGLMMLHALILLCQGMAFSVAMNSKRNHALVGLIIAINFVEMKGTIFKRFDSNKLFVMTCQDVVERFHLCLSLLFVVAEEMDNSSTWVPSASLVWKCSQIFIAEVCIDVIKHAVLGKFNEIRPGVYREFLKDVCDKVKSSHSHDIHRVVCFEPFAPAALFLRIVLTVVASSNKSLLSGSLLAFLSRFLFCSVGWFCLCGTKIVLGYWLKGAAGAYLRHFDRRQKKAAARTQVTSRLTVAGDISKLAKKE